MKNVFLTLVLATSATFAQSADFPDGSNTVTPEALSTTLNGKTFSVKPASGPDWRWQFKDSGYNFLSAGSYSDSGKWSTKDSALCSEGRKIDYRCNEVRMLGADLYLKRDSGEIIKLVAQ